MHHRHRGRCRLAALVAAALCLVAAHEGTCGAAARRLHAVEEEAVLDVAAAEAPDEAARWPGGGAAVGEAKWLPVSMPLAGGLRFPPVVFPLAGASTPWLPGPGGGGALPALVPPFVGATRQEQFSLWASLFNPLPRPPVERGGVSAVASGGKAAGGQTHDVPGRVTFHESSVESKHDSASQSIGDDDNLHWSLNDPTNHLGDDNHK